MSRLIAIALLLLAAQFAVPETTASHLSGPSLQQIERVTAQIRALRPRRAVRVKFASDRVFNADLNSEMRKDNPLSQIDLAQREDVLVGLLGAHENLRDIVFQRIGAEVIGFYDYHRKILYVRNHANKALGVDRHTVAHEYTHALQDQYWNLGRLTPDESKVAYRNSDSESAHHALTEGDAVNTEGLFVRQTYSASDLRALIEEESRAQPAPAVPRGIQRAFIFPYTTGVSFVQSLWARGHMKSVNAAYRRLPGSTYEIMHPGAYLRGWKPIQVRLHGVRGFRDWKQMDDDVNGAFGYKLILWQYGSERAADRIVARYRGDRYVYLQRGSRDAMLLVSVWTDHAAARAASSAFMQSLRARFGHVVLRNGGHVLINPAGAAYVNVHGNRLIVAYAPTTRLALELGTASTY